MDKHSELDCYLYYMWNMWSRDVCFEIFGDRLGEHLWIKWRQLCQSDGAAGAPASFYAECDTDIRKRLKSVSYDHYNQST